MNRTPFAIAAIGAALSAVLAAPAWAANVKITPLGSHEGEFCRSDRALVLEDPDGTRILYDAGNTVRGPEDERLGEVDAVLLSHVHGDHLGNAIPSGPDAGTCAEPDNSVAVTPDSNSVNIVVGKNAKFLVGGEMGSFFQRKVEAAGGDKAQVELVRFGGMREVGGVAVASVPAVHSNGINPALPSAGAEPCRPDGMPTQRRSARRGSRSLESRRCGPDRYACFVRAVPTALACRSATCASPARRAGLPLDSEHCRRRR